jgi:integrase
MPIKPKPLTESKISRSFYKIGGKNRFPDENGVALVLLSDGRRRWTWRGVIPGRADRTMRHLGYWPAMDREAAQRAAADLAGGKQSDTLAEIARRHLEQRKADTGHWRNTAANLRLHVLPKIGDRSVKSLAPQDILDMLLTIESAVKRRKVRGTLARVLDDAILSGLITVNPARSIPADRLGKKPEVKHMAAILDRKRLGEYLRAIAVYGGLPQVRVYLQLSLLAGARPAELREMKWSDVSLEEAVWVRHVKKVKMDHVCPLSRQAVALLEELKPLTGHLPGPFYNGGKPIALNTARSAIHSLGFAAREMTVHGCRAILRSLGDEIGLDAELLEMQLSHKMRNPLGRAYSRYEKIKERRQAMQRWADFLDELRGQSA